MRRWFILICCSAALLLFITACGNEENQESQQLGKDFMEELYNVDDLGFVPEKMSIEELNEIQSNYSHYFTEEEYKDLEAKRFFHIPLELANKKNNKISVQNITFDKGEREQEKDDSLDYDHSFTLILTDQEGNKVDEIDVNGQISFIKTESGFKIDRYYDGKALINMLNQED